jgi:LuxR family transcriptional regulator, maltose regulon positive regulatory protein
MTEPEARESAAAGLREDASRRRALHLTTRDRFPPSSGPPADILQMVGRDRLVIGLDRAAARRVTIISAPAGSGKTSLLRAWANRSGQAHHIAFVPVRRDEQDAELFWLAVLDAVRHASTGDTQPSPIRPDLNLQTLVDRVLSELATARSRVILVIDDLHELNSPESVAHLSRLLTSLPPNGHAILSMRHDLKLGLHRLRLAGELAEIRASDLRFTERETRELLDASGIVLSQAATALLHQRTEGWAAGLRLAALSLAGHRDPERFVAEFPGSDRTVAEYLVAEMLQRQPSDVQDLLLRTCLLDRVNGELADLLTGRPGSERILLGLEDANAFVISLDQKRVWFRYHHLFANLLRLELRRRLPGEVPMLHRRAAEWFTRHGEVADAIRHTQAAGDWPGAARLLADHSFSLILDGQAQTMRALLQAFPPGADHRELALVRAMGDLEQGYLDQAAARLAVAEAYAKTAPPERRHRLELAVAALKLSLARRRGHLAGVVEQVRFLASAATGQSGEDIVLGSDLHAVAILNLGIAEAWSAGLPDAERHLREGADLAREIGRPYLEVACLAQLAFASRIRSFTACRQSCQEAICLAERHGWDTEPVIAPALVTLASNLIWTGEFDEAERWLQRTRLALRTDTGADVRQLLHLATGRLYAGCGQHEQALEEIQAAERLQSELDGPHALASKVTGWMLATQARLGLLGQARASLAALDDQRANSADVRNARAVICLAEGNPTAALDAVARVLDGTAPVISRSTVVESHLLAALAHRELGDQREAYLAAEGALALAEADRLVLPFAMTGCQDLLEALPRRETAHAALLADILDIMRGSPVIPAADALPPARKLSPGELRVLRYLTTNLSRAEIAAELSVSPNTVSTYLRRIYSKLGVDGRSEAVKRAREWRLLRRP